MDFFWGLVSYPRWHLQLTSLPTCKLQMRLLLAEDAEKGFGETTRRRTGLWWKRLWSRLNPITLGRWEHFIVISHWTNQITPFLQKVVPDRQTTTNEELQSNLQSPHKIKPSPCPSLVSLFSLSFHEGWHSNVIVGISTFLLDLLEP